MSATAIERRNEFGVILRYQIGERPHVEQRLWPSDRLRCAVLRSEKEILYLRIMVGHLEDVLSSVATDRFEFAFRTIEAMLNLARDELDLASHSGCAR